MICIVQYSTVQYSTADRIEEAIDRMVSALGKIEFSVTHIVLALTNIPEKRNSVFKYPILSYPILSYPSLLHSILLYRLYFYVFYFILSSYQFIYSIIFNSVGFYHNLPDSILVISILFSALLYCI